MKSMTGFGVGSASLGNAQVQLELRALNHRYQDVRVRVPAELSDHAFFLEQLARSRLGRGRYDLGVRLCGAPGAGPQPSAERIRALYRALAELRDELAPGTELPLTGLLGLPHLIEYTATDPELERRALTEAFTEAAARLDEMRQTEGRALTQELLHRLELARELRQRLLAQADIVVERQRSRLRERLARLLQDMEATLDPGRIEAELAIFADKSDITEELVRLESHFDQLARLFASDETVGRKLDFLLQEVGREVNTIGSKCQFAEIAYLVVELKAEVERMREQVQNVD